MVQGPNDWRSKVGSNLDWEPLSFVAPNTVDIAVCDLDEEVLADYGLHDFDHSDRKIIAGTKAPEVGMIVTMVGAIAGKATGSVSPRWAVGDLERRGSSRTSLKYNGTGPYGQAIRVRRFCPRSAQVQVFTRWWASCSPGAAPAST